MQNAIKKILPSALPQRIETWTSTGVFDSNWLVGESAIWIEYKQIRKKKKHPICSYKIPWRDGQIVWAIKRLNKGAKDMYLALLIDKELIFIQIDMIRIALLRESTPYSILKELDSITRNKMGLK